MDTEKKESASEYANRIKDGIKKKADGNKFQSTFLISIILVATVFSPVLILLPTADLFSKYLPAFLTAFGALAAYWIQLRKPQERWVMYRGAQRDIEHEIDQYCFETNVYANSSNKDKLLADRVSKRTLQLHYEWVPFVPKVEEIDKILTQKPGR